MQKSVSLPEALWEKVIKLASKEGRSQSNLIRRAVEKYVDEHESNAGCVDCNKPYEG